MEDYGYIHLALNALARESKKGGVSSGRVANLIRMVLVRAEERIGELENAVGKKADIVNGRVPMSQLPEGLDDYQEYPSRASFPNPGQSGMLYLAIDTGKTWRWTGTTYGVVSETITLGETSSTAYPGNKGKKNAEDIEQLGGYISTLQNNMAEKAEKSHTHSISDISLLLSTLSGKAGVNHSHNITSLAGYEAFLDAVKNMGVTAIGRDSEDESGVSFCILRPNGTQVEGFTILIASSDAAGLMSPAMVEKLLEVDNKADSDHTHTQSDVEGLTTALSSLETKTSTNKSSTEKNALDIEQLRIQLQGKVVSKTFATMAAAEAWMRDPSSRRQLLPGSNIWIEDENADDLWVSEVLDEPDMSGSTPTQYYYKVRPLKVEVPSLEGYAKKEAENTFTGRNTFSNDVTIRGFLELFGQVILYNDLTIYNAGETDGPSAHISGGNVSVGRGSRYGTFSGRITSSGVGGYSIYRDPLSHSTREKESCLNYEELIFSETGKEDIIITKEDFAAFLAMKQQLANIKAPLNLTELYERHQQAVTFEELRQAQKLYFTDSSGVWTELKIISLRDNSVGYIYYEEKTQAGLKKYVYTLSEVDGMITTYSPEVIV